MVSITRCINVASATRALRKKKAVLLAGLIREGCIEERVWLSSKEWISFRYVDGAVRGEGRVVNLA